MPDIIGPVTAAFLSGAADQLGHECISRHADDIQKTLNTAQESMNKSIDEGWDRDNNASGYSSWVKGNSASQTA